MPKANINRHTIKAAKNTALGKNYVKFQLPRNFCLLKITTQKKLFENI